MKIVSSRRWISQDPVGCGLPLVGAVDTEDFVHTVPIGFRGSYTTVRYQKACAFSISAMFATV